MDSKNGISQEQQLRLKLNPRQMRLGRLLEMSGPEFDEEVRRNLDENPALESLDTAGAEIPRDDAGDPFTETSDDLLRADYATDDDVPTYRTRDTQAFTADFFTPEIADQLPEADDSLLAQLEDRHLDELDHEIALQIIGNLDSNGYLRRTPWRIARDMSIEKGIRIETPRVDRVLETVQTFDPAGIAATDLRECLAIQLERMPHTRIVELAIDMVLEYFVLFSNKRYERLGVLLRASKDEIRKAVALIRSLNPKPGAVLATSAIDDHAAYITPDFIVDSDSDGPTAISLAGAAHRLGIDPAFDVDLRSSSDGAAAFIRSRRDEAADFIDLAETRRRTLLSIITAIVRRQAAFFTTYERAAIRPMVLRDVASDTGFDQSVISRATTGKYILTPRGIFPVKMLFSEGIAAGYDGEQVSSHAVAEELRKLIAGEDPEAPLTDEQLTAELMTRGYNIARRTIAKYRERLGFPVARLRKK